MSATSVCAFLLVCLAVCVRGQPLSICPSDASGQLDRCLTTLEQMSDMAFMPARCLEVQEAWKCARVLVRGCMYTDTGILKVLATHADLMSLLSKPSVVLCLQQ
ncbi:hypothetical protein ACOMHN_049742 [Nucella lapillus]